MSEISELEKSYQQLHDQLLRGELDEEEFKTQVERLRYEDDRGQQWKIGWYTGKWYRYDQGQWVQGTPTERKSPGRLPSEEREGDITGPQPGRRSVVRWLVPALIALLLLASVVLIIGWNADWWATPTASPTEAVAIAIRPSPLPPTNPPAPTVTPAATATSTPGRQPQATPSRTPPPTATRPLPTATGAATVMPTAALQPSPGPTATLQPSPTPPAQASLSPTPSLTGHLFFPVYDAKRQTVDIYRFDLSSGQRERLIEQASQPALSPNGERLAYRSWNRAQRGILVRELGDGHTWVWINFAEAARPSWSPDSQKIVFPSQQEPDRQWRVYRTVLGLEFDRVRRHGSDILGRVPVWLADNRIVYWECPLNRCGLYVMRVDGTQPIQLTTEEHDTAPAASPDGRQIAFLTDRDGNWEIYVIGTGAAGQTPQRLTRNNARDGLVTWSPDGRWLAFASDRSGRWAVWVMRPDGSDQRPLFELGGAPQGEIAYVPSHEEHDWTWETMAWGP